MSAPGQQTPEASRKIGSSLLLLDCISCDKCVGACPYDAMFAYQAKPQSGLTEQVHVDEQGALQRQVGPAFRIERAEQYACFAERCDPCEICDLVCPEDGGPHLAKPRFYVTPEAFDRAAERDGLLPERQGRGWRVRARVEGQSYELHLDESLSQATLSDGIIEIDLDPRTGGVRRVSLVAQAEPTAGHSLSTGLARTLLTIVGGVLDRSQPNPVHAALGLLEPPQR